ncbi:hypothetical protein [Enterovibrio norvegicus]|uniref:hypothetical protein n=1 Tax=Enterovibrio norvegicus TaxID=188144 RepID=UPI000C81FD01|nr:hypothetical protein [Enterovibrio norvegicus]PMN72542.1 hypothetical protein BCT27_14160 [Enterovibrio norvegicus]
MLDEFTNAGLLFNQLPKLLLTSTKAVKSESDLLVKMARVTRQDKSITHDHQFFRNFRKEGFNSESFSQYFGTEWQGNIEHFSEGVNPEHAYAWFQVKTTIAGFKNGFGSAGELKYFWPFIDAHTEVEYQFIKENYGSEDLSNMSSYLKEWLLVERINLSEPSLEEGATYAIYMVMYWSALYELFLEVEMGSDDYSKLSKCLPVNRVKEPNIIFSPSVEVYLTNVKKGWAKDRYHKDDIKWTELYGDIARAQLGDPNILENPVKSDSLELIKPDTSNIKKRFDRWRQGGLISIEELRKNIVILRVPYSDSEGVLTLETIWFINLFTNIQTELFKAGVSSQEIADTFAKYPDFKGLVKDRFERFKETGVLSS